MTAPASPAAPWANRIVGSGEEAPDQLMANPRNWRIHPKAQQEALAGVLDRVGWVGGVLVNRRTGFLVDGHLRVELALSRGEASVPVSYVDLTEEEEAYVLASHDPIGSMAATDSAKLEELMADVALDNAALEAHLVSFLAGPKAPTGDPEYVPPVQPETYVQPGDLWLLGDHRLLCGDATKPEDVARLLGDARPSLMVTDPPYGVEYDPEWRARYKQRHGERTDGYALGVVTNDDRVDWRAAWALSPASVAYVWHSGLHGAVAQESLEAEGFVMRAVIIWVKQRPIFGQGHYHWQHEPCFYAVRKGATAGWVGPTFDSTVWEVNTLGGYLQAGEADQATEHSTQKPVEVMQRPMRYHEGDVYEPFLGSGTTLIAAEQVGRRCFAMELAPRYVQVAIERWQAFTGREATRAPQGDGDGS